MRWQGSFDIQMNHFSSIWDALWLSEEASGWLQMRFHLSRILICQKSCFSIYCPAPFCIHRRFDVHLKNDLLRLVFALACQARQLPDWRGGGMSCSSRRLHLTSASLPSLGPDNTAVATQFMIKIVAQNCRPKLSSPPMAQKALVATAENNRRTIFILENNRRCIAH